MKISCRPYIAGVLPLLEIQTEHDGDFFAQVLNLEEAAAMIASLRTGIQQAMALHQLMHDRSSAPLMMLAVEGVA